MVVMAIAASRSATILQANDSKLAGSSVSTAVTLELTIRTKRRIAHTAAVVENVFFIAFRCYPLRKRRGRLASIAGAFQIVPSRPAAFEGIR